MKNTTRYIDVAPLVADIKNTIAHLKEKFGECAVAQTLSVVVDQINDTPTADVAPVVHAHWEERGKYYKCSLCGDSIASQLEMEHCVGRKWDYCPCCVAKMGGKGKDDEA